MQKFLSLDHIAPHLDGAAVTERAGTYAGLVDEARAGFPGDRSCAGWMRLSETAGEEALFRIARKAAEIRQEADAFVIIGVGGSNNAARAVIEALPASRRGIEILYAGNATAPSAMQDVLRRMEGRSVYLNIIAKNFETLEPGAAFRVLRQRLYAEYGPDAARRILATGTPGSRLHRLCLEKGWEFFPFPEAVGGRYSAFTDVGLLPMAVAGAEIRALLDGARQMQRMLLSLPAAENPALLYAAARTLLYERGYRAECLSSFEPRLRWFSKWWIQLFGESEGKRGRGLLPVSCQCSEELHSMGQFLQEGTPVVFETFLRVEEEAGPTLLPDGVDDGFAYLDGKPFAALNAASQDATLAAHSAHHPCLTVDVGTLDERAFGAMYMFFLLACVFSCRMTGVDPFDQPGVEAYKRAMFRTLGKEESI